MSALPGERGLGLADGPLLSRR